MSRKELSAIENFFRGREKSNQKLDALIKRYWDYTPIFNESEKAVLQKLLAYFRMIELLTESVYIQKLHLTPSALDPAIKSFSEEWAKDETRHGQIIERFMSNAGLHIPQLTSEETGGSRYELRANFMIKVSWGFKFISPAVHMAMGTINEATTFAAYRALQKHSQDPVFREVLDAIKAEEMHHLRFYRERLAELTRFRWQKRLVYMLLRVFWTPVGANNGDAKTITRLLLNTADTAQSFYHSLERNIAQLNALIPGTQKFVMQRIRAMH